jgi:hypothetical protein
VPVEPRLEVSGEGGLEADNLFGGVPVTGGDLEHKGGGQPVWGTVVAAVLWGGAGEKARLLRGEGERGSNRFWSGQGKPPGHEKPA